MFSRFFRANKSSDSPEGAGPQPQAAPPARSGAKDAAEKLMEEVGQELNVDHSTRSLSQDPAAFAEQLKKAIRKKI